MTEFAKRSKHQAADKHRPDDGNEDDLVYDLVYDLADEDMFEEYLDRDEPRDERTPENY
jgi:hypothetical protein